MQLLDAAREAATRLQALPREARVRVVAHLDADGLSGAAILLRALSREQRTFHVTYTAEHAPGYYEGLDHEPYEVNVFVDVGASALATIGRLSGLQIVLDHHPLPSPPTPRPNLVIVNPHHTGADGMRDACGASVALAFAIALRDTNWDLAPLALVGAFGDRQEVGGLHGWNEAVLVKAKERDLVDMRRHLALGEGPLVDVLRYRRPPWDRIRLEDPDSFLRDHGLAPEASALELPPSEAETLASALVTRLLGQGLAAFMVKDLFVDVPHSRPHEGLAIPRLVSLVNAAAREDETGLAVAALLGDAAARRDIEAVESRYHFTLRTLLQNLSDGGVRRMRALQVLQVPTVSYLADVCSRAMEHILPKDRATLAFAELGDQIRCSCRGTTELVRRGLDLSRAMSEAAAAVGGVGGGHSIASGATVPRARFDDFLNLADEILGRQLGVQP